MTRRRHIFKFIEILMLSLIEGSPTPPQPAAKTRTSRPTEFKVAGRGHKISQVDHWE